MNLTELPPPSVKTDLWERLKGSDTPILIYGMGNGGDKLVDRLQEIGRAPADFFASDGFVRGQSFHGKRVLSFQEAKAKYDDFEILVCFGSTRPEVLETVFNLGEKYPLSIPDMPLAGEDYFTAAFYRENYEKCRLVYDILADDISRRLFVSLLWYKLTGDADHLRAACATGDEKTLLGYHTMASAVDVGAYRGDTLREMLEHAPHLRHVTAIEPDEKNYRRLSAYAETVTGVDVLPVHAAAFDRNGTLTFASSGNRNATLQATASYQHREIEVKIAKIDDLVCGRHVDYIKYDTEGAELPALLGSARTIKAQTPALRISVYHRSEDLFALPLWLFSLMGKRYRYYLRRTPCIPAWECELIAVPDTNDLGKENENA